MGLPENRIAEYDSSSALDNARQITGTLLAAASPANPMIRREQLEELEKAMATVKDGPHGKTMQTFLLTDPDYRTHPAELAKLMAAMTEFFRRCL